jgi:hypothetical protein
MDLLVDIIFWFIVIWLVSKFVVLYLQAKNEILKEELDDLTKKLKDKIIAQGADIDEIKKKCADRFKDAVIVADSDELKKYGLE